MVRAPRYGYGPRDLFQQAGIKIETDAERAARRAAQDADWQEYQRQQSGGFPALTDPNVSPLAGNFNGAAPLIAGPSISDRVRGNRYTNMRPEDRQALNLTIAGELSPYSYGKPVTDREVANMVETVTTRAAKTGDSIEDTVRDPWQYSPWNTLPDQAQMRENLKAHGPDVRRMVANAVTGDVMPTHEGLTHYLNRDAVRRIPDWATEDKRAAKVGPYHTFYRDVDPYAPPQSLLPPSPSGEVTSQDLGPLPDRGENDALREQSRGIALGGLPTPPPRYDPLNPATVGPQPPPANALAGLIADPLARPLSPTSQFDSSIDQTLALGGGGNQLPNRPLIAPPPLTPEQVTAGQQRVNEMLDPALDAAKNVPPALAPDTRYDPLSAATMGPSAPPGPRPPLVEPSSPPAPAPMPGNPLGVDMMNPTPITMPGGDQTLAPMATPPLIGSDRPAPVQLEIVQPPLGPPGDYTLGSDRKLRPPSAGPPPLVAPAAAVPSGAPLVTPRRTVTPQTPVSPEPESNLPPPPASVPPIEPVTLGPAAPETAGMGTPAPLIAPPATSPINPRLSPREIEKRARERGFGTVENLTGDRIARGVGAGLGAVGGLVVGGLPGAATFGGIGYRNADDVRRSYMNRTGPFGILGNIFGRGKDKDKKKNNDPAGIKEAAAAREAAAREASRSGSGLGSDRSYGGYGYGGGYYGGGSFPGYGGYGYGPGPDSIGGAYRNR